MKKILFAAIALLSLTTLSSCLKDNNDYNDMHGVFFVDRNGQRINDFIIFADQTEDSLFIASYDSWRGVAKTADNTDWLTFSPDTATVPQGYLLYNPTKLSFTTNTTGLQRSGVISVTPNTTAVGSVSLRVYQHGCLCITVPSVSRDNEGHYFFKHDLAVNATTAPLSCYIYGDATLESDADWLTIPADIATLKPGSHGLSLSTSANQTGEKRVANVTLTSNGVSTVVTYTQKAQ